LDLWEGGESRVSRSNTKCTIELRNCGAFCDITTILSPPNFLEGTRPPFLVPGAKATVKFRSSFALASTTAGTGRRPQSKT